MKINYGLTLTVILVLATSLSVFAQNNGTGQRARAGRAGNNQARAAGVFTLTALPQANLLTGPNSQLNLTDDQKKLVTSLLADYRKALAAVNRTFTIGDTGKEAISPQAALDKAGKELRAALITRSADVEVIKEKIKAAREAEDAIITINITYWGKLTQLLTDEQLKQLLTAITTRPARNADTVNNSIRLRNRQNDKSDGQLYSWSSVVVMME